MLLVAETTEFCHTAGAYIAGPQLLAGLPSYKGPQEEPFAASPSF